MSRNRKRRRRIFALILLLVVPLVSLLAAEGLMRGYVWARGWTSNCYAADMDLFVPHETRGYDLRRGFQLRSGVFRMTINEDGFRGPRVNKRAKKGTRRLRIAVLGGSSVFGYLVNDGEEACQLLEGQLADRNILAEVINAGVPGYNLYQTSDRFAERVAPYKPDLVILYLGYNDLPYVTNSEPDDRQFRVRSDLFAPSWKRRLSPSVFCSFLGGRMGLGTPQPRRHWEQTPTVAGEKQFRTNYLELVAAAKDLDAQVIVCTQALAAHETVVPGLEGYLPSDMKKRQGAIALAQWLHDTVESLAQESESALVDAYREIPATTKYLGDDVHLTRKGEAELARLWAEQIAK